MSKEDFIKSANEVRKIYYDFAKALQGHGLVTMILPPDNLTAHMIAFGKKYGKSEALAIWVKGESGKLGEREKEMIQVIRKKLPIANVIEAQWDDPEKITEWFGEQKSGSE